MSSYLFYATALTSCAVAAGILLLLSKSRESCPESRVKKPVVSHIIFYPIKGCRGIERYSADVTKNGILRDREYAIVEIDKNDPKSSKAISQSQYPKLALIVPTSISGDSLTVIAPGKKQLVHTPVFKAHKYTIEFYGDKIEAIDQGDIAAEWFSSYLGKQVRFVKLSPGMNRTDSNGKSKTSSIFYRTPILLISEESLSDVSNKIGTHLSHSRFRPNIVISGVTPFLEDSSETVNIGSLTLKGSELCERCSIPGVDQTTGELDTQLVGKLRSARAPHNLGSVNTKYRPNLKDNQCYLGVYFEPSVQTGQSTRIFLGQEIDI